MSADKTRIPDVSANRTSKTDRHRYLRCERSVHNVGVDEQILAFVCCCECYFLGRTEKAADQQEGKLNRWWVRSFGTSGAVTDFVISVG